MSKFWKFTFSRISGHDFFHVNLFWQILFFHIFFFIIFIFLIIFLYILFADTFLREFFFNLCLRQFFDILFVTEIYLDLIWHKFVQQFFWANLFLIEFLTIFLGFWRFLAECFLRKIFLRDFFFTFKIFFDNVLPIFVDTFFDKKYFWKTGQSIFDKIFLRPFFRQNIFMIEILGQFSFSRIFITFFNIWIQDGVIFLKKSSKYGVRWLICRRYCPPSLICHSAQTNFRRF